MKKNLILAILFLLNISESASAATETKGLIPEVRANSKDEEKNEQTSYKSELMISKAEENAIKSLEKIIQKKKGSPQEADLLNRLAELHMKRAKSGRFFDLMDKKTSRTQAESSAKKSLLTAISIYERILKEYPKFSDIDSVYFNCAFANLQVGQAAKAQQYYTTLVNNYPKSSLLPDALLEVGEIYYNQQNFETALGFFKRIEAFPKSKAYSYGVYKSAWCYYNLKDTDEGIKKLKFIVQNNPADTQDTRKYNLRKEALRDLTLFVGETVPPQELYAFFKSITTDEELGEVMVNLASLYESHSRYKEISIFMKEFIDKNEDNPAVAKSYVKMIQIQETLKQRDQVISSMKKLSEYCQTHVENTNVCKEEFKKVSLEISKKWWEVWLKNKKHTEFSKLTETAFEILIDNEDPKKPDYVSHHAYAELLFQLDKFEKASEQYEFVSKQAGIDQQKKHAALYGAIYSLDKLAELQSSKKEEVDSLSSGRQQALAMRYVAEFPQGEHVEPLKFKLGFLAYQKQDLETAMKYLLPMAENSKNKELKNKSEDIILDIYNLKKDYKSLLSFSKGASQKAADPERKKYLTKLNEEASYSQMQNESKDLAASAKIDKLMKFSAEYKDSKLSKDALWQSVSLAYSNGLDVAGADLSLTYIEKYPGDSKNKDALKEAIKAYTDAGYIPNAIKGLNQLASVDKDKASTYVETTCDLLRVNYQIADARNCYNKLLKGQSDSKKRNALISKILDTFDDKSDLNKNLAAVEGLENLVMREGIEPYTTQILISKAQDLLKARKYTEAFNASLKINSRSVSSELRAEARLIQAAILEDEFMKQSVKSSEAKFALVLSMKTERLDKAYTAYTSAIKMTTNKEIHQKALEGIDRLYSHFIVAISDMPVPKSLSAEEQAALKGELAKMTDPFKAKKLENSQRLAEVSKATMKTANVDWKTLSPNVSVEPQLQFPEATALTNYLPTSMDIKKQNVGRLPAGEKKCDSKLTTAQSIGGCLQTKNFTIAENLSLKLTATKENRPLGLYYLSVIADMKKQPIKALWLIERAIAQEPDISFFQYQKGKVIYETEGPSEAMAFFEKSEDLKNSAKEISILSGLKSYSQKDFISATEDLKSISAEEINRLNLAPLHIESYAQRGDYSESIKLAEKYARLSPSNPDIYLQLARIYEQFATGQENSKKLALEQYNTALKKSKSADQQTWIKQKIAYLSQENH